VLICLEEGANDLHMVQLMPLPPEKWIVVRCSEALMTINQCT